MELMWLLIALVIGSVLYKYFTGHGGMKISRAAIEGLPQEGALSVGGAEVRWSATEPDVLAVAWPLPSGHWVVVRLSFDPDAGVETDKDPDQGKLELTVADRRIVAGAEWTDQIKDRDLRSDVENVLKALASAARQARSDRSRAALAKPVGTREELD